MDHRIWRKTTYSNQPDGECVEVGLGAGQPVGVRDTKDRAGGELAVTGSAWRALLGELAQ